MVWAPKYIPLYEAAEIVRKRSEVVVGRGALYDALREGEIIAWMNENSIWKQIGNDFWHELPIRPSDVRLSTYESVYFGHCWIKKEELDNLFPYDYQKNVNEVSINNKQNTGGRPRKHDWERFWVEVSLELAKNDIVESRPADLLKAVRDNWPEAPVDDTDMKRRIRELYKMAEKRGMI